METSKELKDYTAQTIIMNSNEKDFSMSNVWRAWIKNHHGIEMSELFMTGISK